MRQQHPVPTIPFNGRPIIRLIDPHLVCIHCYRYGELRHMDTCPAENPKATPDGITLIRCDFREQAANTVIDHALANVTPPNVTTVACILREPGSAPTVRIVCGGHIHLDQRHTIGLSIGWPVDIYIADDDLNPDPELHAHCIDTNWGNTIAQAEIQWRQQHDPEFLPDEDPFGDQ